MANPNALSLGNVMKRTKRKKRIKKIRHSEKAIIRLEVLEFTAN